MYYYKLELKYGTIYSQIPQKLMLIIKREFNLIDILIRIAYLKMFK